jgi:catechol 2,3-dioxygenase-like lactoylglutathione lyase family enzyme
MTIQALDHVNIRTAKLIESITFYADVLGLKVVPPPMVADTSLGAYCLDQNGNAVVHLVAAAEIVVGAEPVRGAAQTGMIDHFALKCSGDSSPLKQQLTKKGLAFETMDVGALGLQLVFVRDPNGILIELNFPLLQQS